jgi:hypothetical protein
VVERVQCGGEGTVWWRGYSVVERVQCGGEGTVFLLFPRLCTIDQVSSPASIRKQRLQTPASGGGNSDGSPRGDATTEAWRAAEVEQEAKRSLQAALLAEEETVVFGCGVNDNGKGLTDKALLKR